MKRILFFIGLKLGEIVAAVWAYFLLCLLWEAIYKLLGNAWYCAFWGGGFVLISMIGVSTAIGMIIWVIVTANWQWAKKLSEKEKK